LHDTKKKTDHGKGQCKNGMRKFDKT